MLWTYSEGTGAQSVLRFAADNTLDSITCRGSSDAPESCPDVMGVAIGTPEDQLINRLGPPGSSRFIPNGKVISLTRLSDDRTVTKQVPVGLSASVTRRISWRELATEQ